VRFKLVKKAVEFYSQSLPKDVRDTISHCLNMIHFGMKSTLFAFQGQYFEYDGDGVRMPTTVASPSAGGYESAWLADLVAIYILDNTRELFKETLLDGFYRDDGFAMFKSTCSYAYLCDWRNQFQEAVNLLAEGDYLQYTLSIWLDPNKRSTPLYEWDKKVSITTEPSFPYLDMELFWDPTDSLSFRVHLKPNQQLKYLNSDSTHSSACLRAIPIGVSNRLAKLTTIHPSNEQLPLSELYPLHFNKLEQAGLLNEEATATLSQEYSKYLESTTHQAKSNKHLRERDRSRTIYFCVGYSKAWVKPIHRISKKAKQAIGLSWLRVSMSYHRFPNLREYFQRDLSNKLHQENVWDVFCCCHD
jgi:hypothetical protein